MQAGFPFIQMIMIPVYKSTCYICTSLHVALANILSKYIWTRENRPKLHSFEHTLQKGRLWSYNQRIFISKKRVNFIRSKLSIRIGFFSRVGSGFFSLRSDPNPGQLHLDTQSVIKEGLPIFCCCCNNLQLTEPLWWLYSRHTCSLYYVVCINDG